MKCGQWLQEFPSRGVGVYRCLGVFMGVVNTVGGMEPILLIQKRRVERRGVYVFVDF